MLPISNLFDLGSAFRMERKALGMTQADVARKAQLRRESIIRLEAGENMDATTVLKAVSALGKGLAIVDRRLAYEDLAKVFDDGE